jgi:hypothetical protein
MASAALAVTSAGSAGGITALGIKMFRKIFRLRTRRKEYSKFIKGDGNGNEQNGI